MPTISKCVKTLDAISDLSQPNQTLTNNKETEKQKLSAEEAINHLKAWEKLRAELDQDDAEFQNTIEGIKQENKNNDVVSTLLLNDFVKDLTNLRKEINAFIDHHMSDTIYQPEDEEMLRNSAAVATRKHFIAGLKKLDFSFPHPLDNSDVEIEKANKKLEEINQKNIHTMHKLYKTCHTKCTEEKENKKENGTRFLKVLGEILLSAVLSAAWSLLFGAAGFFIGGPTGVIAGAIAGASLGIMFTNMVGGTNFTIDPGKILSLVNFGREIFSPSTPIAPIGKTTAWSGLKLFDKPRVIKKSIGHDALPESSHRYARVRF